jgi:hypothetical protein
MVTGMIDSLGLVTDRVGTDTLGSLKGSKEGVRIRTEYDILKGFGQGIAAF